MVKHCLGLVRKDSLLPEYGRISHSPFLKVYFRLQGAIFEHELYPLLWMKHCTSVKWSCTFPSFCSLDFTSWTLIKPHTDLCWCLHKIAVLSDLLWGCCISWWGHWSFGKVNLFFSFFYFLLEGLLLCPSIPFLDQLDTCLIALFSSTWTRKHFLIVFWLLCSDFSGIFLKHNPINIELEISLCNSRGGHGAGVSWIY